MKLLYTVGDSFTYGEELEDCNHAWPHVLGRQLGYEVVNEGRPGCGNDWSVKRTINCILEHNPDLVVIGWTSCGRVEFNDKYGPFTIWPGCSKWAYWLQATERHDVDRETISRWLTMYSQPIFELRTWLRQVILVENLLKNYGIEYRFVNTFDNFELLKTLDHQADKLIEMIDTDKFVGWPDQQMQEMMGDCPKGPGDHPLELGHQRIAEAIYETLCTTR
jgi:hypothetical protein